MRTLVTILLGFLGVVLETSLASNVAILKVSPNLFVLALVIIFIWLEPMAIYGVALIGGLILDISSAAPMGLNALRYLLISVLFVSLSKKEGYELPFVPMIISFLYVLLAEGFMVVGNYLLRLPVLVTINDVIGKATYTSILMMPVFFMGKKIFNIESLKKYSNFEMKLMHTKK